MKSYNLLYSNQEELDKFIALHNLAKEKGEVFVQIFTDIIDKSNLEKIISQIKKALPSVKILGTTTDGEISGCGVYFSNVLINFTVFEKSYVYTKRYYGGEVEMGLAISKDIKPDTKAIIIFADGLHTNGEKLIKAINKKIVIAGGLSGDNFEFKKTYIFNENDIYEKGCVVAFLGGEELTVNNDYRLNWEGVGKKLKVTKAKENRVYEINNLPIKDIYKKYFGDLIDKFLVEVGIEFPLITYRKNLKVARAVLGAGEDYLYYGGNLYEGEEIQFGYANVADMLTDNLKMYQNIFSSPIEVLFLYECVARKRFFGKKIAYEYMPLCDVPVAGFYTYGEFFADKSIKCFFNHTITLLALSENNSSLRKNLLFSQKEIDDGGEFLLYKALVNLIKNTSSELTKTTQLLGKIAYMDGLTKILNRKGCMKELEKLNSNYVLLLMDIDFFKSVNDEYGHDVGDEVLKEIAKIVKNSIRKEDIFCRFGGEEFVVILPSVNFEDAVLVAEKLRKKIEEYVFPKDLKITISIGVAPSLSEFKDTFKHADNKLYKAKKEGRNRVRY